MARSLTELFSVRYSIESSLGTAGTVWYEVEPNDVSRFGASITTTPRNPISADRQLRKGVTTDLDSGVELEADLIMDHVIRLAEGFVYAQYQGGRVYVVSSIDSDSFTVTANGAALAAGTLVYGRGFTNSGNNGLLVVDSGATATDIPIVGGLTAEASPPANATLEVAGVRGATGDLEIDSNGDLISTTLDFTGLDLETGQFLHVGGTAAAQRFATTANFGLARAYVIEQNKITLDKKATTFTVDDGSGKDIDILFGRFLRNVSRDDANFLEQSYHFEGGFADLDSVGTPEYAYAKGNYANVLALGNPLTDKAGITFGFVGQDVESPYVTSQKTGADSARAVVADDPFSTASDFVRLRVTEIDETGLTTDFQDTTLTIDNGVTPEKVLDVLGARYLNLGQFTVSLETTILFTNSGVIDAIRNNTTVTMEYGIRNADGAMVVDLPAMTLGDGAPSFPRNETIKVSLSGQAFKDQTLGYTIGISFFPFIPAA